MHGHEWELIQEVLWWFMMHNPSFPPFSFLLLLMIINFCLPLVQSMPFPSLYQTLISVSLSSLEAFSD